MEVLRIESEKRSKLKKMEKGQSEAKINSGQSHRSQRAAVGDVCWSVDGDHVP